MGGCSSKPKTAEYEGVMELQEEPHDAAPRKSVDAEKTGLRAGLNGIDTKRSIQTLLTESERDGEERQVFEDERQHVKQILAETINDSGPEKGLTVKEEKIKLQINPDIIASELDVDPVFIMEVSKTVQETPLLATLEAETVNTLQRPLTLLKENSETKEKDAFSKSKTQSMEDTCIGTVDDASTLLMKLMGPQDGLLEPSKNLSIVAEILELQKKPSFPEGVALGLQKDACNETSSKGRSFDGDSKSEHRLDDSIAHQIQDPQSGEGSKECEQLSKESEAGASEVVDAGSGVLALERGKYFLKDSRKPLWEDETKGLAFEEAAEELKNDTCIVKNLPFAEPSGQKPSRGINCTHVIHPDIITDVKQNDLQHVVDEQHLAQEEQEVDLDAAYKVEMKDMKPQADIHPVSNFLAKVSNLETVNTFYGDSKLISTRVNTDDKHSLLVSEESSLALGEVQNEKSYSAVVCIEGQPKSDASCNPDEVTASQVIATTKKPQAQSVHVMEFTQLALNPAAQDIPAPDIDEVLEKLASEFERQESLARTTS